jgi:hypothetical protein
MKNIVYYLITIPVIYSGFMVYKTPTVSDAIIVASLSLLVGFVGYLTTRYSPTQKISEIGKLEEELKIERMKLSLDQVRENAIKERSIKDARAAMNGYEPGKQIKF